MNRLNFSLIAFATSIVSAICPLEASAGQLKAGAAAIDVSPQKFPVIVNGGFLQAIGSKNLDRLHSRAVVLDDGTTKLAIAVVDSCMMPRDLLDKAKAIASNATGIPVDRMMISATHTHTAPSAMWALGTPPDEDYVAFLPGKIAESIITANSKLQPARIGFSSIEDYAHTHNRRWIRRPDKMVQDPFGNATGRAHMHPGYQNPEAVGPSGPVDPGLSVVSVQTPAGKPIALLANYSMHYFGIGPVSADYYGKFVSAIAGKIGAIDDPGFVGIMSQGTSGDLHWMDYSKPKKDITIDQYADEVAAKAFEAYGKIAYRDDISLAMAQTELKFKRRVPDEARLQWAKDLKEKMAGQVPKSVTEVYACEAIALDDDPQRELKLQALRIGEIGIAAIPNEVYALTGLKIKAMSPLPATFNIELANGAEGYIPPPEQHSLGGYTTWPARTAALEVEAETKITEVMVSLLEKVSGKPRRPMESPLRPIDQAVLKLKPSIYWRLEETGGARGIEATGNPHFLEYVGGIARFLPGPQMDIPVNTAQENRAVHLADGYLSGPFPCETRSDFSISLWFRRGIHAESGKNPIPLAALGKAIRVGMMSEGKNAGHLFFSTYSTKVVDDTKIEPGIWNHLVLTKSRDTVSLYLNGQQRFEFETPLDQALAAFEASRFETDKPRIDFGGISEERAFGQNRKVEPGSTFEGKLDDIAIFERVLSADEVKSIYRKPVPFEGEQ